jgi:3-oxoacyl-[acyl-carrier-protein] synthase III
MHFQNVSVQSLTAIEPPIRLTSAEISRRLGPTLKRLGIRENLLEDQTGIVARRVWDEGTLPSDAATQAAEKALEEAEIDRERIGLIINTSVCRDYLEPSTACIVHGNLGLSEDCLNFDVGNACLAFMNGMDIAARMIERGDVEYALIVDGETSGPITEATIGRLLAEDIGEERFRSEFASLTLGSGAAAMVMAHANLSNGGHRYTGSVTRSATRFSQLCRGHMDWMETDTRVLLEEGLKLAATTFQAAAEAMGWEPGLLDLFVIHQVSRVHTQALVDLLGLDPDKVMAIFPEMGNVGPASVPMTLARAVETAAIKEGDRVALMGIGSGLNCSMAEILW